ncbi:MAG: hypothetical protein RSB59_04680, partial [Clostridia bacterium]
NEKLSRGIFWVIAETEDELIADNILFMPIYCDMDGTPTDDRFISNAKSGNNYNHEASWKELDRTTTKGKQYNYYPRGRVEVRNGKGQIYLNGNINDVEIVREIKCLFGLNTLSQVRVIEDNSQHYLCHFDK